MNKFVKALVGMGVAGFLATGALAADRATKDEAVAMVHKAGAHLKAVGKERALADFSSKSGGFVDRDLYLMVYDMAGNNLAHGANEKLIGKNLMGIKDVDGKEPIKEFVATAKASGKGWVDYKWPNPVTKAIEAKTTYIEKFDDIVIGAGVYK